MTVQLAGAHPVPMPESHLGDGPPTRLQFSLTLIHINKAPFYVSYTE